MHLKLFKTIAALSLLLSFLQCFVGAHGTNVARALRERGGSAPGRQLKAATKAAYLAKRHTNFFTTNEVELTYTERENLDYEPNFAAAVRVESPVPVLLLEDFEHLSEYIACQPGYITIHILPGVDRAAAKKPLLSLADGGLVITSHYGCNTRGERGLLRVGTVAVSEDGTTVVLDTMQASWESSFRTFDIKMYHTTECHALRPHEELRRRQDATATVIDLRPSLTVSVPTASATSNQNQLDVNHGLIDKNLLPDNSSIQVTCKNCSTFGTIDFSFVSFKLAPDVGKLLNGFDIGDFFQGGEVTVVANNLGARVELLTNITKSNALSLGLFEVPLVFGIAIPGIGSAGLIYAPSVDVNVTLNGSIAFTYGFEIDVPSGSKLFLDMTDPTNSSISGFGDTKVTGIPFQAAVDIKEATIDVSLRHQIQIGFDFHAVHIPNIGAEIGVYLDLPKFQAGFTHMTDVDENCTALATSQSRDKDVAQKVLTDVYLVDPNVNWHVGIAGGAHVLIEGAPFDESFGNGSISDVPSSCLNFNQTAGTYVSAAEVVQKAKKNGAVGQLQIASAMYWIAAFGVVASLLV